MSKKDPAVDMSKVENINDHIPQEVYEDPLGNRAFALHESETHGDCYGFLYEVHMADGGNYEEILFQRGDPEETGINGLTNELLLGIVKHRIEVLDKQLPAEENKKAVLAIDAAIQALEKRFQRITNERKVAKKLK